MPSSRGSVVHSRRPSWRPPAVKAAVFLLWLFPAWRWLWLGFTQQLGGNPPEFLVRSSGIWALVALGLVLAVTPLRRLLNLPALARYRRMLGLFAFFYATLHVLGWALWEHGLLLSSMWRDIVQRTFILVGVLAWLPLVLMAVTSTQGWMRRLGKGWRRLHASVYAVAALSLWHFWLVRSGKQDFADVWVALALSALWLAMRVRRPGRRGGAGGV